MPNFELSHLADGDIAGIIHYTIERWDADQAIRYVGFLDAHFEAIGNGEARTKAVFEHRGGIYGFPAARSMSSSTKNGLEIAR